MAHPRGKSYRLFLSSIGLPRRESGVVFLQLSSRARVWGQKLGQLKGAQILPELEGIRADEYSS